MARVVLAGYNLDAQIIDALTHNSFSTPPLTPETICSAYARISRDSRDAPILRALAIKDVEKARQLNQRIMFGLGHASIAEHAVLNLDILELSRLAVEEVENNRLASYTEKSQRYIRLTKDDYVIPLEIRDTGVAKSFCAYVERCFERYARICKDLESSGASPKVSQEDARYVLPLAVSTQLGMTANMRTLERMVLKLLASPIGEVVELGKNIRDVASNIAPSLIRYCEPSSYYQVKRPEFAVTRSNNHTSKYVRLISATPRGDDLCLSAFLTAWSGVCFSDANAYVASLTQNEKEEMFRFATKGMSIHDPAPRELEHCSLTYEIIISSAAFNQLKRHRMTSMTRGPYDPMLGVTVPPSFDNAGLAHILQEAVEDSMNMLKEMPPPPVSWYVLLNAHRRRVIITLNLRELYHISRLREDAHAQWDIRGIVSEMTRVAREVFPICGKFLGGKDSVEEALKRG